MTETTLAPAGADAPAADPLAALGFRLNFFKLVVRDLASVQDFYARAFGMVQQGATIELPGLREVMLTLPGERFTLVLYQHTDAREIDLGSGYGPVGFLTRDVAAAQAHVVAQGGRPGRGPMDLPGMKIAFAFDPEGHEIEMIQLVRAAAPPKE